MDVQRHCTRQRLCKPLLSNHPPGDEIIFGDEVEVAPLAPRVEIMVTAGTQTDELPDEENDSVVDASVQTSDELLGPRVLEVDIGQVDDQDQRAEVVGGQCCCGLSLARLFSCGSRC
jgi:hypothetical protein